MVWASKIVLYYFLVFIFLIIECIDLDHEIRRDIICTTRIWEHIQQTQDGNP